MNCIPINTISVLPTFAPCFGILSECSEKYLKNRPYNLHKYWGADGSGGRNETCPFKGIFKNCTYFSHLVAVQMVSSWQRFFVAETQMTPNRADYNNGATGSWWNTGSF